MRIYFQFVLSLALLWACASPAFAEEAVSFNRDIRPILSQHCFACHGPDTKKGVLRFDNQEGITDAFGEAELEFNEAWLRMTSKDVEYQMPPPKAHTTLTLEELEKLKRWIAQGAVYQGHWSFDKPTQAELPEVQQKSWVRNEIDTFVLGRLEKEQLKPSPEATKLKLLRRLTLDLTGLPPTAEEIDAFLADKSPEAYEKVVDRLLASPHFGERMAVPWLDAARYADTNGFSIDDHRDMWLWREWVIDAFNRNMPYDQFIQEQVAGDLMPNATKPQQLATGFLRNSMNTHEGGTIPEEYRVIYIADKVDTVSTVFMGLTMRCAQCHDHKYDPLSQQDYYQFYAFFDTAHEPGKGATNANTPPIIRMDGPLTDRATYTRDIESRIATLNRYLIHPPEMVKPRALWEASARDGATGDLAAAFALPVNERTGAHWQTINEVYAKTTRLWGRHLSTIKREIAVLQKDLEAGQSSVMVMKEKGPRQTYVLTRGDYSNPDKDQPVSPAVPSVLPRFEEAATDAPLTRLSLARWLTQPDHPLTARVAVNRYWQMLFGRGIVSTPYDFGSQGAFPTHPKLLDWLAVNYSADGWDTKRMIKMMVMSSTYRQSSNVSRELLEKDPYNELLARASRFRLPAEFIRDGALAMSDQLERRVGGPSVYPTQPHGLWREISHFGYGNAFTAQAFYPSDDSGLNRRSMYTFWKRTSPPPSLIAFDAPSREVCTVQRSRTNTPLQALVLLNDPDYVGAARALAKLTLERGGKTTEARLDFMFRRATARLAYPQEQQILKDRLNNALSIYHQDANATAALVQDDGAEVAAWTVVASVILNLDEVITRE